MNIKKDYDQIEAIIWDNEKLETALDEIVIDLEESAYIRWVCDENIDEIFPSREKRIKTLEEIGAFDFCNGEPMEWAKEYCKDAVFAIYDDDEFDEDELIENLIIYCQENMIIEMLSQCDF